MRILWISDSPTTPSGFGGVTAAVTRQLVALGHHVEILGWQSRGSTSWWEGIPVHPVRHDQFGADVLTGYLLRTRPQVVVTLGDVWWMAYMADAAVQQYLDQAGGRWALYYPIDGADPDGSLPHGWRRVLQACDIPIAMSRFGQAVSAACGVEAAYIPHGVDLALFAPPPDKQAAKSRLGYEGKFVVLSDARNQPRKLLPRTLDIASLFVRGRDDVVFHLHTDPDDDAAHSDLYRYDLRADIEVLGLRDRIAFTQGFRMKASGGIPLAELAAVYQAADVHLLSSWGEGFGLPTLQAAAAGVVPLAVAYSASRELVEGHGGAIPAESAVVDEFGLVRCLLSREAAANALADLYEDRGLLAQRSAASRAFALRYSWDEIGLEWDRVLATAPARRRPERSHVLAWVAGSRAGPPTEHLPAPVRNVAAVAFDPLPEGTSLSVRFTERTVGELAGEIRREAFTNGDELSIPVRLGSFFDGAPRSRIGSLLVSPGDLPTAVLAGRIFPGLRVSVPRPGGDPESHRVVPIEELAPALLDVALVIDHSGTGAPRLDLACAALGIPYLGPSALWLDGNDASSQTHAPTAERVREVRLLLTDQGLSEWRRDRAHASAVDTYGDDVIAAIRATAIAGRREAEQRALAANAARATSGNPADDGAPGGEPQMYLVRRRDGSGADANLEIARHAAEHGGLLLMATRTGSLIVAMPEGGKEVLDRHPEVGFVGPVSIDPNGRAAKALRSHFARNVGAQLAASSRPQVAAGVGR